MVLSARPQEIRTSSGPRSHAAPRPAAVQCPRRALLRRAAVQRAGAPAAAQQQPLPQPPPQHREWAVIESPASSQDGEAGGSGSGVTTAAEGFHPWRWGSRVHYYTAGESGPALLLVHGFGVGGHHFERNFADLSRRFRVFAVDLLGQGASWPAADEAGAVEPDPELGALKYSAETWTLQLVEFVRDVVGGGPVYMAGNSLGGYLAVNLAAGHPGLVKGLVLLNATPFWSFRADSGRRGLFEAAGLDGTVPVPRAVRATIERLWWRNLSSPGTVKSLLSLVYASPVDDERLLERILEATQHPGAIQAFASIVLSPKTKRSFDENVRRLDCPVLLLYGQSDPWVVPLWGQRLKRAVPHAAYYELSNVGHCPHHEAPASVNRVLCEWITAAEERLAAAAAGAGAFSSDSYDDGGVGPAKSGGGGAGLAAAAAAAAAAAVAAGDPLLVDGPLRVGESMSVKERSGVEVLITHVEGAPRNVFERADAALWALRRRLGGGGAAAPSAADARAV
ncbi:hypothetical protein Rsub_10708 [Raphidocelis subcapitata]|uniref:AB hydrolase-1 domain-containing protein n=1 Tax=Raphidocelis subcapitata TaxID=307507 RepID=A0A2V0PEC5_9CHLO|nr:hypothetical protein Rsub_10708 [Raphidocelis subcapitata]|eukprot:GBF98208.1 hypothetical protein Rsub_10708 [Raphidocelis subcapitata]